MAGPKTHEQQLRIIEKRENTANADDGFNAEAELKRSKEERDARRGAEKLRGGNAELADKDDRQMLRGENQESPHHKRGAMIEVTSGRAGCGFVAPEVLRGYFPSGSAILRCCLASVSAGVTLAIADISLFFQPDTTSPSPFIIAS